MKIIKLTCPNCGAKLNVELRDGQTQLFCQYCGQKILLTPDYEAHVTITNDAEVKRASTEEKIAQHEIDTESKNFELRKKFGFSEIIIGLVWIVIIIIALSLDEKHIPVWLGMLALMGVVGAPLLIIAGIRTLVGKHIDI